MGNNCTDLRVSQSLIQQPPLTQQDSYQISKLKHEYKKQDNGLNQEIPEDDRGRPEDVQFLKEYFHKIGQFKDQMPKKHPIHNIYYSSNWSETFTGDGVRYQPNQALYNGSFVNGLPQGLGQLQYIGKQCSYKGYFKANVFNGQGTYQDKLNKQKFEGEWFKSEPIKGKLTLKDETIIEFEDFASGKSVIDYQDGDRYEGFIDTITYLPQGHGKFIRTNGSYSQGQWKQGKLHGYGIQIWKLLNDCVQQYKGQYVQGRKQGRGTQKYKDGSYYEGEWKNNQIHGKGVLFSSDHKIEKEGIWQQGYLMKKIVLVINY